MMNMVHFLRARINIPEWSAAKMEYEYKQKMAQEKE